MDNIDINLNEISPIDEIEIDNKKLQDVCVNFGEVIYIDKDNITDHDKLKNLDYEHSGHTGFASSEALSNVDERVKSLEAIGIPEDGLTPYIGENGNWFIGEEDTGVQAEGQDGKDGTNGVDGVGIETITQGEPYEKDDYTITPITFTKSNDIFHTFGVKAKNGKSENLELYATKEYVEGLNESTNKEIESAKTTAQEYTNQKAEELNAEIVKKANQGDMETALSKKADIIYVDNKVSQDISSVQSDLNNYKSTNDSAVKANSDAISVLNGNSITEGSVDYKVNKAINEFAQAVTSNDTIDTFAEVISYVATHGEEFSELVGEVDKNTKSVETLNGADNVVGSVDYKIKNAIANENLSQYATDSELKGVSDRVKAIEDDYALDSDLSELSTQVNGMYTNAQIDSAVSNAQSTANSYTDSKIEVVNKALDGKQPSGDYALNSDIPTKVSELENDSGFKTTDNNTTYALSKSGTTITLTGSDGSTTSVEDNTSSEFVLPQATKDTLGGVKVGDRLSISSDGTLNGKMLQEIILTNDSYVDTVDDNGISLNYEGNEVTLVDEEGNGISYNGGAIYGYLPIVAGNGISIVPNDNGKAEIKAKKIDAIHAVETYTDDISTDGISLACDNTEIYLEGEDTPQTGSSFVTIMPIVAGNRTYIHGNEEGKAVIEAKRISSINFNSGDSTVNDIYDDGIYCEFKEIEIETVGENEDYNYDTPTGGMTIPIVAGEGISITRNSNNKAEISTSLNKNGASGYVDTFFNSVGVYEDGLSINGNIEISDGNDTLVDTITGNLKLPIVAGDGISIAENNDKAVISSTDGLSRLDDGYLGIDDGAIDYITVHDDGVDYTTYNVFRDKDGEDITYFATHNHTPFVGGDGIILKTSEDGCRVEISNAKKYVALDGGFVDFQDGRVSSINDSGIAFAFDKVELEEADETTIHKTEGAISLPLVAGSGITFTANADNQVEISVERKPYNVYFSLGTALYATMLVYLSEEENITISSGATTNADVLSKMLEILLTRNARILMLIGRYQNYNIVASMMVAKNTLYIEYLQGTTLKTQTLTINSTSNVTSLTITAMA